MLLRALLVALMLAAAALLLLSVMMLPRAYARDDGQWTNQPQDIRDWFKAVKQPGDSRATSCCGEGDAFDVEMLRDDAEYFYVRVINGRGEVPDGMEVTVPRNKLQTEYGNPTGKIILFMTLGDDYSPGGYPICLIPLPGL